MSKDWFAEGNPEVGYAKVESMRLCSVLVRAHSDILAAAFENDDPGLASCAMHSLFKFTSPDGLGARTVALLAMERFGLSESGIFQGALEGADRFKQALTDHIRGQGFETEGGEAID